MRATRTRLTAVVLVAALPAATRGGDADFAVTLSFGRCVPVYGYGGYPACGGVLYGADLFGPPIYGYRAYDPYIASGIFDSTVVIRGHGDHVIVPGRYAYAHRGYDRYAYRYGQYHYPGRHYAYSYGYRFRDVHPHAVWMFRGPRLRDFGHAGRVDVHTGRQSRSAFHSHANRDRHTRVRRQHVIRRRHIVRRGHHR